MDRLIKIKNKAEGQLSVILLFFATMAVLFITGLVFLATTLFQNSARAFNRSQAFAIAEAGIEYYRWHLAHAPNDFWDGKGSTSTGPYPHPYYNKDGAAIGQFILEITPPPIGSKVVTIRSTGKVNADSSISRVIEAKFGIESFVKYAIAVNDNVRFGTGTEVFGEIMANGGIRFDGLAHNLVRSSRATYDDPDHGGQEEFGVHTHVPPVDPLPPAPVPSRPDVFAGGRLFPVPGLDFTGITQTLSDLKTKAQNGGYYASSSRASGWDLVFSPSAPTTTFSLYKVTATVPPPGGCTNTSNQPGWGTWSIQSETLYATGTIPANGIFFFEDNVWVRGQIKGARITVGSGVFPENPSTWTSITVNSNLLYSNYDGTEAIGLIAQNNFNVGLISDEVLRIDAALVAQNGRAGRYYYTPPTTQAKADKCGPTVVRQELTLFGSIVSNERYGFGYTDSTGYQDRNLIYDSGFLYNPPPDFPLAGSQYTQISWREIQ
jgi:hypothetical protein